MPHAPEMTNLPGFQRDLPFAMPDLNDPDGLVMKAVRESYYMNDMRHGRLYPTLDTLVADGFFTKGIHDQRTNKYELTERGRSEVLARIGWPLGRCPPDLIPHVAPADASSQPAVHRQ